MPRRVCELSFGSSGTHDVTGSAAQIDVDDLLTLSARAGYVFDNTMIYGRVGYQTGELGISTSPVTPDLDGAVFGLGVELIGQVVGIREVADKIWLAGMP